MQADPGSTHSQNDCSRASMPRSGRQTHDLFVQLDVMREQRRFDLLRIGNQADQPVTNERRLGREAGAPSEPFFGGGTQKVQHEVDARTASRHIILQYA